MDFALYDFELRIPKFDCTCMTQFKRIIELHNYNLECQPESYLV